METGTHRSTKKWLSHGSRSELILGPAEGRKRSFLAATKGTLGLLVGGDNTALNRCRDAFAPLGKIYHCGSIGMGQIAKLANNAIAYTTAAAVDEARVIANAYGMDLGRLMQVIVHGTGQCFVADKWDYVATEWSHLRPLGKKDLGLLVEP